MKRVLFFKLLPIGTKSISSHSNLCYMCQEQGARGLGVPPLLKWLERLGPYSMWLPISIIDSINACCIVSNNSKALLRFLRTSEEAGIMYYREVGYKRALVKQVCSKRVCYFVVYYF